MKASSAQNLNRKGRPPGKERSEVNEGKVRRQKSNRRGAKSAEKKLLRETSAVFAPLRFCGSAFRGNHPSAIISSQHYPPNPFFQPDGVEIKQQPKSPASQTQLAQQLRLMNGLKSKHCVGFHNNAFAKQQ